MANEWICGYLRDSVTAKLAATFDTTGATWQDGFKRAADGTLLVKKA